MGLSCERLNEIKRIKSTDDERQYVLDGFQDLAMEDADNVANEETDEGEDEETDEVEEEEGI